jgi:hypothetical protein
MFNFKKYLTFIFIYILISLSTSFGIDIYAIKKDKNLNSFIDIRRINSDDNYFYLHSYYYDGILKLDKKMNLINSFYFNFTDIKFYYGGIILLPYNQNHLYLVKRPNRDYYTKFFPDSTSENENPFFFIFKIDKQNMNINKIYSVKLNLNTIIKISNEDYKYITNKNEFKTLFYDKFSDNLYFTFNYIYSNEKTKNYLSRNKLIKIKLNDFLDILDKKNDTYIKNAEIYSFPDYLKPYYIDFSLNYNESYYKNFFKLVSKTFTGYTTYYSFIGVLDQNNFFNNILLNLSDINLSVKSFLNFFIEDEDIYFFIEEKQKRNSQINIQINIIKTNIYELLNNKNFKNYVVNKIYLDDYYNKLYLSSFSSALYINNIDKDKFTLIINEPKKVSAFYFAQIKIPQIKIIYINKKDLSIHKVIRFQKGLASDIFIWGNNYLAVGEFSFLDLNIIFKKIFNRNIDRYYVDLIIDLRNPDELNSKYLKESKQKIKQSKDFQILKEIKITNLDIKKEYNDVFYIQKYELPNDYLKIEKQQLKLDIIKNPKF